jgi:hypothetical protein
MFGSVYCRPLSDGHIPRFMRPTFGKDIFSPITQTLTYLLRHFLSGGTVKSCLPHFFIPYVRDCLRDFLNDSQVSASTQITSSSTRHRLRQFLRTDVDSSGSQHAPRLRAVACSPNIFDLSRFRALSTRWSSTIPRCVFWTLAKHFVVQGLT